MIASWWDAIMIASWWDVVRMKVLRDGSWREKMCFSPGSLTRPLAKTSSSLFHGKEPSRQPAKNNKTSSVGNPKKSIMVNSCCSIVLPLLSALMVALCHVYNLCNHQSSFLLDINQHSIVVKLPPLVQSSRRCLEKEPLLARDPLVTSLWHLSLVELVYFHDLLVDVFPGNRKWLRIVV